MGIYAGFKPTNSTLINKYSSDNAKELTSSLGYLEGKQQKVLGLRDEVDTSLDGVDAADEDKSLLDNFKKNIRNELSSINESKYVGDYDRQINKIVAKTKNGIETIEANKKAQQAYIAEAKKAGLTEESIQKQLALSRSKGSLKYDSTKNEFSNHFSGRALAPEIDLKTTREALATLKAKKFDYVDKAGNHHSVENFSVIPGTMEDAYKHIKDTKMPEHEAMKYLAGVMHYNDIKNYHDSSPEFQAKLQRDKEYNQLVATKLDPSKLDEEGLGALTDLRIKYAPKDEKGRPNYDQLPSAKEAYLQHLNDSDNHKSLSTLTGFAALRNQDDSSFKWDERSKFNAENQWEKYMAKYKSDLDEDKDIRAENRKTAKEDMSLMLNDASIVQNNPYTQDLSNPDGSLNKDPISEKGVFQKTFENLWSDLTAGKSNRKNLSNYNISEIANNALKRDSPTYARNLRIIETSGTNEKAREAAEKQNMEIALANKDKIRNEVSGITKFQPRLNLKIGKKDSDFNNQALEQLFGKDLSGWGRSFRAREINGDGTVESPTSFETLIKEKSGLKLDSDEFKKAIKGESGIIHLDGYRSSDGDLRNGMQITIKNPDNGEVKTYAVELPIKDKVYKGKNSQLTETEAIKASQQLVTETDDKTIHAKRKGQFTQYRVFDKSGKLLDDYNIHDDGTGYSPDWKRLEN